MLQEGEPVTKRRDLPPSTPSPFTTRHPTHLLEEHDILFFSGDTQPATKQTTCGSRAGAVQPVPFCTAPGTCSILASPSTALSRGEYVTFRLKTLACFAAL